MKGILSREEKGKKVRRSQLIIGLILILVMVFGTVGYAFSDKSDENPEKIEYNGVKFIKANEYWNFNLNGNSFITKYNPKEVENITLVSYLSINSYTNKPLYIVSDSNEPNYEISRNLNPFVLRIQNSCISEEDCIGNLPVKNCSEDNVIIIKEPKTEGITESIFQQDNCIFITSSIENQTRYADVFLFKILGI
ncbi:MAG: hypothetical protein PHH54_02780 [Candidatus Nanoarchaeia archaeon]|nr:hypothetical protein [Candidatus Nanoarchaeia archaeon]